MPTGQLEGLDKLKYLLTLLQIKPTTHQVVAYCHNQPDYRVPHITPAAKQ
jgi:hypothetical protein